eukprot:scaffold47069_cov49-Prasinocladus_malaysianus.AAC.1
MGDPLLHPLATTEDEDGSNCLEADADEDAVKVDGRQPDVRIQDDTASGNRKVDSQQAHDAAEPERPREVNTRELPSIPELSAGECEEPKHPSQQQSEKPSVRDGNSHNRPARRDPVLGPFGDAMLASTSMAGGRLRSMSELKATISGAHTRAREGSRSSDLSTSSKN